MDARQLLNVSELEQELACNQDHSGAMDKLLQMVDNFHISWEDKLRLVCLYALRYEQQKHQIPQFKKLLRDKAGHDLKKLQRIHVRETDILLVIVLFQANCYLIILAMRCLFISLSVLMKS